MSCLNRTLFRTWITAAAVSILIASTCWAGSQEDRHLVLTSLQVTYSITAALLERTQLEAMSVITPRVRMDNHARHFKRNAGKLDDLARNAEAVITIKGVWRDDPLYNYVRVSNIRVIEIDATFPHDPQMEGIAVLNRQGHNELSPYVWLSLSNAIKMAGVIAGDLARISPPDAPKIEKNLTRFVGDVRALRLEYETKFLAVENLTVVSLTDQLVYLTSDQLVDVAGYVLDEGDLTDKDLQVLTKLIRDNEVPVVIHKWMPDEKVVTTIEAAGAKIVVLSTIDPGLDAGEQQLDRQGYMKSMRSNLEALYRSFSK